MEIGEKGVHDHIGSHAERGRPSGRYEGDPYQPEGGYFADRMLEVRARTAQKARKRESPNRRNNAVGYDSKKTDAYL